MTGFPGSLGMAGDGSTAFPGADREIGRRRLRRRSAPISIAFMEDNYCFAGNPLDRAAERRRDTEWVASLLADPAARILPLCDLRPLTREAGPAAPGPTTAPVLDWQILAPWREAIERGAILIFLGLGADG